MTVATWPFKWPKRRTPRAWATAFSFTISQGQKGASRIPPLGTGGEPERRIEDENTRILSRLDRGPSARLSQADARAEPGGIAWDWRGRILPGGRGRIRRQDRLPRAAAKPSW